MTLHQALERLLLVLSQAGMPDARLEAELLLAHAVGCSRVHLYAYREQLLSPEQEASLAHLVKRRLTREPLAYILGRREFFGLEFIVRSGVFLPRPETELLVQRVLSLAGKLEAILGACTIVDVGTGCGNIAVALAVHTPTARIYATDTSAEALAVARENAQRHGVADRVILLLGDLLAPLPEPADVIVANLPYIPSDTLPTLQPEIQWEPRQALDGGPDGLDVLRCLLRQTPGRLCPSGYLLLEMAPEQRQALTQEVLDRFPGATVEVEKDLAGHDRMLVVQTPPTKRRE